MSVEHVYTAPNLYEWLKLMQTCSGNELCKLAVIICYGITCSVQVPHEMQLRAIFPDSQGKDTLVSAGTGSSKTLPIALNVLLDNLEKNFITLTLSLLKCLQVTQELDFNTQYSIPTVVVNEDTPREDLWWNDNIWNQKTHTHGQAWLLIVTVEQLFKSCEGHLPCLAIFLRNQQFQQYVVHIVVDKAHNIHTAGLPHYRLDTFHLVILSTTFPLHIHATIESKLLKPGYTSIHVTSNQLNTAYAMHKVVNNIKDMKNYMSKMCTSFSLCILIFVDKELACHISTHLDSCLPSEWHNTGIVMHYHSVILQQYLQLTHNAFTTLTGNCCILAVTLGQSMGVDFLDIKIICTADLPSMMVNVLQHGSCALCNSQDDTLFIILYEHWVHNISLDEYNKGDMGDPDCPGLISMSSAQALRSS
ncbi:hypothetical protein V8E53_013100 [Lactarius tabidus]